MRQGSYTWQPPGRDDLPVLQTELHYDWQAIQWLLDHVHGNLVILESSETDYYRAGGTRIASTTGLSGVSGFHEGEQRHADVVGERNARFRELWETPDLARTQQLMDELNVSLIYVGQLEQYLHPEGTDKFAHMAENGLLTPIYENERVVIYAVPGQVAQTADGDYVPHLQRGA